MASPADIVTSGLCLEVSRSSSSNTLVLWGRKDPNTPPESFRFGGDSIRFVIVELTGTGIIDVVRWLEGSGCNLHFRD